MTVACPRCASHWRVMMRRGGLRFHECRECGAFYRECDHEHIGMSDIIECLVCRAVLHDLNEMRG